MTAAINSLDPEKENVKLPLERIDSDLGLTLKR